VAVPAAWLVIALGVPILELLWVSTSSVDQGWFEAFSHVATAQLYRRVLLNTVWISLLVVFFAVIIAYPLAYIVGHATERMGSILFVLIVASMWLSLLIRTYAWTVLLQRTGPLSAALVSVGLLEEPKSFMHSRSAVVIGMTHIMVPYMVVSILSAAGKRLRNFALISRVFGATTLLYFIRVFLPLTARGAAAGSVLVFLLSLGFYITPELLGGGKGETMMIAVLIDEQISTLGNWANGAALSLLLTATVFVFALATYAIPIVRRHVEGLGLDHES
jgi:ABC-type spermidine/putrescine transport system permease subunit I